jgi:hypothetical protein
MSRRGGLAFLLAAAIVRVPPIYFLNMPDAVRQVLEARGCTVPQAWGEKWPGNAVRGHFISPSSDDWAVLCSRGEVASIVVISGGRVVASLASSPDENHMAGVLPGRTAYERQIERIAPKEIERYCRLFGEKCPPIRHDGIEDFVKSNASEVRYFDRGKWVRLPGAD